ncbi:MAG: MOSC domain-containing protein [Candidatus Anammoximicrobium sp.]|nr:MOSC domain-containing protein [Candidatus Anammoximicrobium sp.]
MSSTPSSGIGTVVSLLRYPIKSMQGEEVNSVWVAPHGVLGDRALALLNVEDGKVVSAKNPRKWPRMFDFRAAYVEPPCPDASLPPVRITLPDGTLVTSDQSDADAILSRCLEHSVTLRAAAPQQPQLEEYWPDMEELDRRNVVTDEAMPAGTFFDLAPLHLLTTATLAALQDAYPQGRFEVRRFRPNFVIQLDDPQPGFAEDAWIDRVVAIGDEVRLRITGPCPRCVMTTLPQSDLPADPQILRTAARQNKAHVGVYASVIQAGPIRRGDRIGLAE